MDTATKRADEPVRDINVLPLIDVLLVLLIIFMVMLRGLIFIPAQVPAPAATGSPPRSGPQIVLELRKDGSYAINSQPIPAAQLVNQLHAIFEVRPVKLLFIEASDSLPYQAMITAMDLAREAGVQELAWVPRGMPPEQRGNSR